MKFHEKVVSYYESCNSPVDKEGYLYKKGEFNTSYQKRWCVLKGNLLFYKDRPADRDVIGVIVLEGCTVQLCESEEQFAFSLVWSEPGLRTYKFAAEDQGSQESWIKALLSANHSYLALLVMDMEKKYREALNAYSNDPLNPFTVPNCSTAGAGYPAVASFTSYLSTQPSLSASALASVPNLSQNPTLQPPPPTSTKSASRRSPKLWPKRSTIVAPANSLPAPLGEWSGVMSGTVEDFSKMHDDFGKEVKELIANWAKKGHGDVAEGNLIDFG